MISVKVQLTAEDALELIACDGRCYAVSKLPDGIKVKQACQLVEAVNAALSALEAEQAQ